MKALGLLCGWLPGILLFFPDGARAQEAETKPPAPFVAQVPENAAWKVMLTYRNPDGTASPDKPFAPAGYPTEIQTVKTGASFQFTVFYAGGRVEHYDQIGNFIVAAGSSGPRLSVADPDNAPFPNYSTDFPLVAWVRAAGEAAAGGTVLQDGIRCFHYQDGAGREAWINEETLLPVAAKDGLLTEMDFQFGPPPSSPLVFPPDEIAVIAGYQKILKAFNAVR